MEAGGAPCAWHAAAAAPCRLGSARAFRRRPPRPADVAIAKQSAPSSAMRAAARAAALLLLCIAAGVAAAPAPMVVCPLKLQLSQAPWTVAALDFPAGADLALTLKAASGSGAAVAAGQGTTGAGGAASISLVLAGTPPPPGLYTLRAVSTAAAWQQAANVTLVGRAPLLVRPARECEAHRKPLSRPRSPRAPHARRALTRAAADHRAGQGAVQARRDGAGSRAGARHRPSAYRCSAGVCASRRRDAPRCPCVTPARRAVACTPVLRRSSLFGATPPREAR